MRVAKKIQYTKMSELHEAAFAGTLDKLEECLERSVNSSEPDPEWGGKGPLHIASSQGHKKCVLTLLMAGADVNAVSDVGWTAGHFACETGQADCLATLLSYNLDLKVQDYAGDTAKRVAEIYNKNNCLDVIREHIAKQEEAAKSPRSPRSPRSPKIPKSHRDWRSKHFMGVKGVSRGRSREGSTSKLLANQEEVKSPKSLRRPKSPKSPRSPKSPGSKHSVSGKGGGSQTKKSPTKHAKQMNH